MDGEKNQRFVHVGFDIFVHLFVEKDMCVCVNILVLWEFFILENTGDLLPCSVVACLALHSY